MAAREGNPEPTGMRRFDDFEGTSTLLNTSCQSLRPQTASSSNMGHPNVHWRSYQTEDFAKKTRQVEEQIYQLENRREDDILFSHTRHRHTSLLWYDIPQMILEFFSIFAILLSSSLRWTWPINWIQGMGWTFLFNLDIYDFAIVYTPNVYVSVQAGYTASTLVPVPFWAQMTVWAIITVVLAVVFLVVSVYLWHRASPRYYVQIACVRRYYLLITQFLALPFGATLGKVFHCTSTNLFDVDNKLYCFGGTHWAYLAVAITAAVAFYFLIPAYMIYRTDRQIVSLTSQRHEAYLRLKEHEYQRGLDALWYISEFFIFSSFRRAGIFYRPVMHLMKLVIVGVYAGLFNSMQIQGVMFSVIFFLMTVAFCIVRPYRVGLLNIYLIICYACLGSLALMGALRSSFTSFTVSTPFLLPTYTTGVLGLVTGAWFLGTIIIIAIAIRQRRQLWPALEVDKLESAMNMKNNGVTTRKYVKAVLRAKAVIEYAISMPPMFAPVHELSRQVLLINALFREAEASNDPIQDTLWDILEELSQLHARLLPRSLFAESVKPSVRRTAAEFLALMPQLARRLHQREYDFIMVHPIRRRILFKLYVMAVFIRGSRDVRDREKRVSERVGRVWRSNDDQNDIYYPCLYPETEEGPSVLSVTMPIARELRKDDDRRELELKAISNSLVDLSDPIKEKDQTAPALEEAGDGVDNVAFDGNEELREDRQENSPDSQSKEEAKDPIPASNTPRRSIESSNEPGVSIEKRSSSASPVNGSVNVSRPGSGAAELTRERSNVSQSSGNQSKLSNEENLEPGQSRPASGKLEPVAEISPIREEPLISFDNDPSASAGDDKTSSKDDVLIDIGEPAPDNGMAVIEN